ncbi:DUF5683 domain-containing protein [Spirosoma foliorum]|uniref:DUF5683 domain-containing protein n=1 Tax=Spirosoma foliorum TaxID=2710596 RepID=A0A7G5GQM3_9BACT|nr:DUF5683 domain-containing protein [Spirosoma foliorum]QMW01165.1 hypothetical protein H3H32_24780 [Spirosoma foliorum]
MKPFPSTFVVFLLLILTAYPLLAQNPAIKPAPTPAATDSTRQIRSASDTIPATIRRNGIKVGTSVLTPDDDSTSLDKPDTLRVTAKQEAQIHKIIPKKATLRSVMLPGLGQAYNRQYYKIPFIYAGYGVMGYLFFKYRGLAQEAAVGYGRLLFGDKVTNSSYATLDKIIAPDNHVTQPVYVNPIKPDKVLIGGQYFYTSAGAKNAYDTYRRYRDLNVLLSIVLYAVNIVEANVAAHLKTFDLTDDISMLVEPNVIPMPGTGLVPGVRVAFTFK